MHYSILSLLPQDPSTVLNNQEKKLNILRLVDFFVEQIITVIEDFYFNKKLQQFDAHVGDTLCQVRAYMILLLAKKEVNYCCLEESLRSYKNTSQDIKQKIEDMTSLINNKQSKYNKILDASVKLYDFLANNNFLFIIPADFVFLVQSRFLSVFNNKDCYGISLSIDYQRICSELNVANTAARKIPHIFQKRFSELSCSFVMDLCSELSSLSSLLRVLPYMKLTDNHNRLVLPCFEVTKSIIEHLFLKKQLILIIAHRIYENEIDKVCLLYTPNHIEGEYQVCEEPERYHSQPVLVIRGTTIYNNDIAIENKDSFMERFNKIGVKKIILANMANHPQYSAKELESFNDNPYLSLKSSDNVHGNQSDYLKTDILNLEKQYLEMRTMGKNSGCCLENQSLFFVKHIFCDMLCNQIKNDGFLQEMNIVQLEKPSLELATVV